MARVEVKYPQGSETYHGKDVTVKTRTEKPEVTVSTEGVGGDDMLGGILSLSMVVLFCLPCAVYGFYAGIQQGSLLKAIGLALFGGIIVGPVVFCFSIFVFCMSIFASILCGIVGADWPGPLEVTWDADLYVVTNVLNPGHGAPMPNYRSRRLNHEN